jgi:hypothetical protein
MLRPDLVRARRSRGPVQVGLAPAQIRDDRLYKVDFDTSVCHLLSPLENR